MTDTDSKVLGCLFAIAGIVGITIVSAILNGWAISTLWLWFVVPKFELPELTILQAIGLALLVGVFKTGQYDSNRKTADVIATMLSNAIVHPILAVTLGYIVSLFM